MWCAFIPGVAGNSKPGFSHFKKNTMIRLYCSRFFKQEKKRIILAVTAGFVHNACTVLLLLSIGKYIELAFNGSGNKSRALHWAGIHLPDNITVFYAFFFSIILIKVLAAWAEKFYSKLAALTFTETVRAAFFRHLLSNQSVFKSKPPSGHLVWFSSDLKALQRLAEKGFIGFVKDFLFISFCLFLLARLSIVFALILFCIAAAGLLVNSFSGRRSRPHLKTSRKTGADVLAHISKKLTKAETDFESLDALKEENRLWQVQSQMLRKKKEWFLRTSAYSALAPFLMYSLLGGVMMLAANSSAIELSPADVLTFLLLLLNLFSPMGRIIRVSNILNPARLSLKKLNFMKTDNLFKIRAVNIETGKQIHEFSVN
jgi:ABC-type multidrug transport system fused ATPase/permease subunit